MNYVDNNQGFQNRGYSNQGFNSNGGQPFRSNNGGQGRMQPQRFNNFNQQIRPYYSPNYNSGMNQHLPPQQTEGDIVVRLGNLIKAATEENAKLSETTDNMLINMVRGIENRIDAWEYRVTGLDKRIEVAERQILDVTEAAKREEEKNQDYCQMANDQKEKKKPRGHVYYVRDVSDDEITPYVPPLPFPGTIRIAEKQKKDYDDATGALKIIEESPKSEELMQRDASFKIHHERLVACKKWFETRTGYYGLENPYPTLEFPYDHFSKHLVARDNVSSIGTNKIPESGEESEDETTAQSGNSEKQVVIKREDPGCFTIPCSIHGETIDDCILDLGASKSVMPLHLSQTLLIGGIEETDTSIVLADWTTIKPSGFVRNVPITVRGHVIPTDFLVVDTKDRRSKVILGRPFLSSVGAEIRVREKKIIFNINKPPGRQDQKPPEEKPPWKSRDNRPDTQNDSHRLELGQGPQRN